TPNTAKSRPIVGEGVKSWPRAGCRKSTAALRCDIAADSFLDLRRQVLIPARRCVTIVAAALSDRSERRSFVLGARAGYRPDRAETGDCIRSSLRQRQITLEVRGLELTPAAADGRCAAR